MTYICDPDYNNGYPQLYEGTYHIRNDNCMWWRRELREVREVHTTANGTQIELFGILTLETYYQFKELKQYEKSQKNTEY